MCIRDRNTRSIILSANDEITIELGEGRKRDEEAAEAAFDGENPIHIVTGDRIIIHQALRKTCLLYTSRCV